MKPSPLWGIGEGFKSWVQIKQQRPIREGLARMIRPNIQGVTNDTRLMPLLQHPACRRSWCYLVFPVAIRNEIGVFHSMLDADNPSFLRVDLL